MNTRIRTIAPGVQAERIAVETHMFYDPVAGDASVVFQGQEYLEVGGVVTSRLEDRQALTTTASALALLTFPAGVDPVTGIDLSTVSGAGVTLILKAIYDTLHNEVYAPAEPSESQSE